MWRETQRETEKPAEPQIIQQRMRRRTSERRFRFVRKGSENRRGAKAGDKNKMYRVLGVRRLGEKEKQVGSACKIIHVSILENKLMHYGCMKKPRLWNKATHTAVLRASNFDLVYFSLYLCWFSTPSN